MSVHTRAVQRFLLTLATLAVVLSVGCASAPMAAVAVWSWGLAQQAAALGVWLVAVASVVHRPARWVTRGR